MSVLLLEESLRLLYLCHETLSIQIGSISLDVLDSNACISAFKDMLSGWSVVICIFSVSGGGEVKDERAEGTTLEVAEL